jgi:hypothetical protein
MFVNGFRVQSAGSYRAELNGLFEGGDQIWVGESLVIPIYRKNRTNRRSNKIYF